MFSALSSAGFPALLRRAPRPLGVALVALLVLPGCSDDSGNEGSGASTSASAQTPPAASSPISEDPDTGEQVVNLADLGFNEGDEGEARVYVVEFSDFGCMFCARFHLESYSELNEEFVEEGDIVWKYIPISIGGFPNGVEAALAGTCAGMQDRVAPMRDLLFERRREWSREEQDPAILRSIADEAGLDMRAWDVCMDGSEVRGTLTLNNQVALQIGVTATPTFLVQGQAVQGAPPLEAFREALRGVVEQVGGR